MRLLNKGMNFCVRGVERGSHTKIHPRDQQRLFFAAFTQVSWKDARKFDRARVSDAILSDAKVRQLLITRSGYKKEYTGANFEDANLKGANLTRANLQRHSRTR
jgi:uncharacterized protein YjbI with pentapeptide repeats